MHLTVRVVAKEKQTKKSVPAKLKKLDQINFTSSTVLHT
jgi:hypothetical protein